LGSAWSVLVIYKIEASSPEPERRLV